VMTRYASLPPSSIMVTMWLSGWSRAQRSCHAHACGGFARPHRLAWRTIRVVSTSGSRIIVDMVIRGNWAKSEILRVCTTLARLVRGRPSLGDASLAFAKCAREADGTPSPGRRGRGRPPRHSESWPCRRRRDDRRPGGRRGLGLGCRRLGP
jgi:hypothetical protein